MFHLDLITLCHKNSWPNLYSNLPYNMGQDFLDIQYFRSLEFVRHNPKGRVHQIFVLIYGFPVCLYKGSKAFLIHYFEPSSRAMASAKCLQLYLFSAHKIGHSSGLGTPDKIFQILVMDVGGKFRYSLDSSKSGTF